ncbi:hypothetical protein GEPA3_1626 [Geobacillus sp. PA-3]|uniref:hypothetical protein n=1 Tax=Geobacillus sp. PA-3 TaxID=1699078 RepID=UPI0006E70FAB|nr:hypothetical protein [Geobacillus sp. PA-3]KQB93484.1 hypothetical protein GEPA3_1626 [Geobacillus sp. PA-3]
MAHYIWIIINALLVIGTTLYIWLFRPNDSAAVLAGKWLAQVAVLLFLINVNMYFIFLVIRKTRVRKVKVILARISRSMMKVHIPLAVAGTGLIVFHGVVMAWKLGTVIGLGHGKLVTGYVSIAMLAITLFAGVLRRQKASGWRRRFHLTSAMLFACFFLLHLFWPI